MARDPTKMLIWYGHLTTPRQLRWRGALALGGGLGWIVALLVLPLLALVALAFAQSDQEAGGAIRWEFTLLNFSRALGFGSAGWDRAILDILLRSVVVALVTTVICVLLAYPLAFFIAMRAPRWRYLGLTLVVIPFCTNLAVRVCAWEMLLAHHSPLMQLVNGGYGMVRTLALALPGLQAWATGWPDALRFSPGPVGVYIGMVSTFLPFMVLPLYASAERMDWSILEAARDLYASRRRVFLHAILPQTLPGLSAGIILTFVPAMGMFLVSDRLGGGKQDLIGNLIQRQFSTARDYPFGAALSLGLMLLTLLALFVMRRVLQRTGKPVNPEAFV